MKKLFYFVNSIWLFPFWAEACPRCLESTPYKSGLFWAVMFLLPIPFLLIGWVAVWVIRHSKTEFPPV